MKLIFKIFFCIPILCQGQKDTLLVYQNRPFVTLTLFNNNSYSLESPKGCSLDTTELGSYILTTDSSLTLINNLDTLTGKIYNESLILDKEKWFLKKVFYSKNKVRVSVVFNNVWNIETPSFKRFEFYESGVKKSEGSFRFLKKNGTWKYFSEEGNLIRKEKWNNGIKR